MTTTATKYLGLDLPHPLIPSSSPLSKTLDSAKQLEDNGAAALVLYSLFEEEINESDIGFSTIDDSNFEATSYLPNYSYDQSDADNYVEHVHSLKDALDIPIVASINGISLDGWVDYSKRLQQAGADAIELNAYYIAADFNIGATTIEEQYLSLVKALRADVDIPISIKLSPYFSSLGNFALQLQEAGADGVAMFNRFYQPDIDIDSLRTAKTITLSTTNDALLPMHWIALLRHQIGMTLSATGGVHNAETAIKMILAGADAVYLCSTLLQQGPAQIGNILSGIEEWLEESPYETLDQAKGTQAMHYQKDPIEQERSDYIEVISGFKLR